MADPCTCCAPAGGPIPGLVRGGPWPRADGYCLLVDRDLSDELGGLSSDYHWWWAVTKLQADLLRRGYTVTAIENHESELHHVGGGSGPPPRNAKGMQVTDDEVRSWFDGESVSIKPALP